MLAFSNVNYILFHFIFLFETGDSLKSESDLQLRNKWQYFSTFVFPTIVFLIFVKKFLYSLCTFKP